MKHILPEKLLMELPIRKLDCLDHGRLEILRFGIFHNWWEGTMQMAFSGGELGRIIWMKKHGTS